MLCSVFQHELTHSSLSSISESLRLTASYRSGINDLLLQRFGFIQRGLNYTEIRRSFNSSICEQIFVFHHFDKLGRLPVTWSQFLIELSNSGWYVLFSTSYICADVKNVLTLAGIQIAYRTNIGQCIGAYKDLSLLLSFPPQRSFNPRSLVLCNDSNLLATPPSVLLDYLKSLSLELDSDPSPTIAGFTDSIEREKYHLQSYFLYINHSLLCHPCWFDFWSKLTLSSSKDDLINNGEIAFTQHLLSSGISVKPLFSFVDGLIFDMSMPSELRSYDVRTLTGINQTLFAWRSLIMRGYPFIKKSIILNSNSDLFFDVLATLSSAIPADHLTILASDIRSLFASRYYEPDQ